MDVLILRTSKAQDPQEVDHLLAALERVSLVIQGYIIPSLLLLGIFGNTISVVVFVRTRKRADAPVQYLSCLAVSDTGVILTLGFVHWLDAGLSYVTNGAYSFSISKYSTEICRFRGFTLHTSEVISAWIIVAFSMERAFVVLYPLKRLDISAKKRSRVIVVICFISSCLSIHKLILSKVYYTASGLPVCFYPNNALLLWQYDTAFHNYFPCFLIVVANSLILVGLSRGRRSFAGNKPAKSQQDNRIVHSLLIISTLYLVFMLPASLFFTYMLYLDNIPNLDPNYVEFIYSLMSFLDEFSMLNYCLNFVIYGCSMPFYRREVWELFTFFCRRTKPPSGMSFTQSAGRKP
jgi:hypothetical protein